MSTTSDRPVATLADRPVRSLASLLAAVRTADEREVWMPIDTAAEREARAASCEERAQLWDDVWHAVHLRGDDTSKLLALAAVNVAHAAREHARFWRRP